MHSKNTLSPPRSAASSLVELLRQAAAERADQRLYTFLGEAGEDEATLTYAELDARARQIGAALQQRVAPGTRALLLYPPGPEYIAGFFGCLYAGLVAVPAYPPDPTRLERTVPRLRAIIEDARAEVVLTTDFIASMGEFLFAQAPELRALHWMATDALPPEAAGAWRPPAVETGSLAFLQYTSGSTGTPKGVRLSHGNLLHNLESISRSFQTRPDSTGVIWLPPYHDMGLIGGILEPLYQGFHTALMSPLTFLRQPLRWLEAVSRFGGTISGGPNFAFDLCVRKIAPEARRTLDLSRWEVAFCGAEPIRAETLDRFAEAFAPCGFRREAFYPCYGLAEGTLIVSGGAKAAVPVLRSLEATALEQHRAVVTTQGAPDARTFVGSGGSLPDQELVIVDPETRVLREPGTVGEIWVSGPSVAQGYWERPEETGQTFGARLAQDDARTFLRTGDLGVLLEGELFVTGRRKDLIILRGRNHYPQDLEHTVEQTHPALRPGCGAAFSVDVDGEERLVVVQEVDARKHADLDSLLGELRQRLSEQHEVRPHALVLLEAGALPKTSSGKVQRRASRAAFLAGELASVRAWREAEGAERPEEVSDATAVSPVPVFDEDAVASWLRARLAARAHLRPEQLDADEAITRWGLDSLGAAELAHEVEQGLGAVLPLEAFLRGPSLRELTALVQARRDAGVPPLRPVARGEPLALSFAQQRLWFLDQLDPSSSLYNLAVALRLEGPLDVAAMERAFAEVVRRHEALRTTFVVSDGAPTQVIAPPGSFTVSQVEVDDSEAGLLRQAEEAARAPFDLEHGPLLRAVLLRNAMHGQVLVVTVHHVVFDGASMGVMIREVSALYAAFTKGLPSPLPVLPLQYADYAAWQRQALRGEALEAQLSWWRQELHDAPQSLALPTDFPRPSVQSFRGARLPVVVPRPLAEALEALSRREGVTPFMTLLASFQFLLHRYSAQDDFCVGAPIAGRNRAALEGLIGFFVNTLVHRARFSGDPSFLAHLARVKHSALGAFAHQDVPFEKLVEVLQPERDLGRTPLFQVMFTLQPDALPQLALPGLAVQPLELHSSTSKFDLDLSLTRTPEGFVGAFEFSTDLFEVATVQRLARHLRTLLESIVARPDARVGEVSLLPIEERQRVLVEWNDTARSYPSEASIPEVFASQVALFPESIAVEFGDERLTYRQLDARSNQLAHLLRQHGVGPDAPVALCLERSLELVVALVAILKAGGAYLPLDASYPRQRLAFMLEDVPPQLLLTSRKLRAALPTDGLEVLLIEDVAPTLSLQPETPLRSGVLPEHLAYIDFTSGSTGRPKPVGTTHRSVLRTVRGIDYARLGPGESFLLIAPISFDASTLEVWGPLLNGSRLVVFPPHSPSDVAELVRVLEHHRVSTLHLTAGLFSQVIDSHLDGLRHVRQLLTGGDVVSATHFQRALDGLGIPVTACYGPTESTLFASTWRVAPPTAVGPSVPIGRPLANTQLYLLDGYLQPVPPGLPGEVFIAGDGLARGYLANPSLTAERFLPNPFSATSGARMYRTGDLARHRPDGTLDFLGRLDSQVKVRGFRVEIAEVEAALLAHPDVREAVVLAREDSPGLKRLVAYFTSDAPPSTEALRTFLAARLPDYMLPAAFLHLAAFPLTANAKLDRKALPAPDARPALSQDFVAPRDDVETRLTALWASVLHLQRVGIHDNFFALGGHSLLATQALSRIRSAFGIDLPLRDLFDAPTVASLALRIHAALLAISGPVTPALLPVPRTGRLPLSFAQQRLFFLDQLEPLSAAYNIPAAVRLEGMLDVAALERSLGELIRRHESLRTTFHAEHEEVSQRIAPAGGFTLPVEDLRAIPDADREDMAARRLDGEARRPFDLTQGPLLRASLLRTSESSHVLLLTMHHIVSDGWSVGLLIREVSALYAAFTKGLPSPLPALPLQYADYAAWQRQALRAEALEAQLSWWRQELHDAPQSLALPTDFPRPTVQSFRGARLPVVVPRPLAEALEALSRREGVTPFMTLLASFQLLLHRYSAQDDFCVGAPIAGRNRAALEGLIGFFVNTLVHRARFSGNPSFLAHLARVKHSALGAFAHQDVPFEKLVEVLQPERDLGRTPLFQMMFTLQPDALPQLALPGLAVQPLELHSATSKFDLDLSLTRTPEGFVGAFEFSTDLFEVATVQRLAGHLRTLLESIVARPEARVGEVSLLPAEERQRVLVEWNDTARPYPGEASIPEVFASQVALFPEAVAVEFGDERLTYAQLNARANQLAHLLRQHGVGPDAPVALCLERSVELIVSLLAILKAGGAYLPLDASYPRQRLAFMLEDVPPQLLLTSRELKAALPTEGLTCLCVEDLWPLLASHPESAPRSEVLPEHLAYIDFTSGSTGRPKPVGTTHRAVLRTVRGIDYARLGPGESFLLIAPISFDASTLEVWGPLLNGSRLVVFPPHSPSDVTELVRVLEHHRVSTLHLTAGLFSQVIDSHLDGLRHVRQLLTGGDVVSATHFQRALDGLGIPVTACYGPTESTLFASTWRVAPPTAVGASVPIGRPLANTQLYLLDGYLQPVPPGLPGEVFIAGEGLARGYLANPSLTAERFLPNPFSPTPGARMYRTGDLARHRPDGTLDFLGRLDSQVKVRGFRVEIAEVEAALLAHPDVREAVVLAREDSPGLKRLVAYFTSDAPPSTEALRTFLAARLPDYMLPAAFLHLPAFPLTANAKLDRKALPAPDARPALSQEFVAPRDDVETRLASLWASVLHLQRVGIHDNFFALGGDSITSLQLVARARQAGLHLSPKLLFQHQTIAALAPHVAASRLPQAEQGPVAGPVPLTPIQRAFFEEALPHPHHFNQSVLLETRAPLDVSALKAALDQLVEHHDALRSRFVEEAGVWRQHTVLRELSVPLHEVDLSDVADAQQAVAMEAAATNLQTGFDLSSGLLLGAALIRRGAQRSERLLLTAHHLVVDAVSWRTLVEDLESLYLALSQGRTPSLPAKTTSFKTWAQRLESHAASGAHASELPLWSGTGQPAARDLPRELPGENTLASAREISVALTQEETRLLLQDVPTAWRARIEDVLVAALAGSLFRWTGHPSLLVELEGHGREDLFDDVDVSRTVGWFTTAYPVTLEAPTGTSPGGLLRAVRDRLGQVPHRGLGYGLLRYLGAPESVQALRAQPSAQVSFNYLGQFDQLASASTLFALAPESTGPSRHQEGQRRHLLELTGRVLHGRLELGLVYSAHVHHAATAEQVARDIVATLRTFIAQRASEDAARRTPAEFPLARLEPAALDRLLRFEPEDLYPLSPMQQGMLFHVLLNPGSGEYFEQITWAIHSRLDLPAFHRAWQALVTRHPALRTSFHREGLEEPLQVVHSRAELPWRVLDWRGLSTEAQEAHLQAFLQADRVQGFDLTHPPLMRFTVMRLDGGVHRVVWSFHHLLLDGWSLGLLLEELFAPTSRAAPAPAYRDYIAWLGRQDLAHAEAHWRKDLAGFSAPTQLPGERRARAHDAVPAKAERTWTLPAPLTARLQDFARGHQLTPNTVIQAAWALLLGRYSGDADVVFGTTVAGRPTDLPDAEAIVGLFINTLPIRVALPPDARVVPWLQELQARQAELRQHEHSPLVRIQGWSELPRGIPLFNSLLVFENWLDAAVRERTSGLDLRDIRGLERTTYPLNINILPGDALALRLSYDTQRFDGAVLERVLAQWQQLLSAFVSQPDARLADLALLTDDDRHQLLSVWNDTRRPVSDAAFAHERFEARAARTPDAVAVTAGDTRLTFAQLESRANQLAHHLRARGVGPDVRVGLFLERSVDLVVAVLGILKAGGAYVPLDPEYPRERLSFMLADSRVPLLVTREALADVLPATGALLVCLDSDARLLAKEPTVAPARTVSAGNLAYVLYTSGSTGRPKGVMVEHQGLGNYLDWCASAYRVEDGAGAPVHSPLAFDLTVTSLLLPLTVGRPITLIPEGDGVEGLQAALRARADFSLVKLTPTHLSLLAQGLGAHEAAGGTRAFVIGGEALSYETLSLWRQHAPGTRLLNEYGPTETVVGCCVHEVGAEDTHSGAVPIGRPIANVELHVLDAAGRLVPAGLPGELFIAGLPLARGYLERPDLTAERFVPHPFSTEPGARMYRTGDIVRRRLDGVLEFLGRADAQVKLRGFRIELGEIEAVLASHPSVRDVAVLLREDTPGDARLAAYVTGDATALEGAALRAFLEARLPGHMIPSAFVALEALPLTPNGKVDRKALPVPTGARPAPLSAETPRTPTEELLAGIWAQVLRVEQVGRQDDFFELGGHSLIATQVVSRVQEAFAVDLPLGELFEATTLAALAARIDVAVQAGRHLQVPPLVAAGRTGELPLSFAQQRLWFLNQLAPRSPLYNIPLAVRLKGTLVEDALARSFQELIRRHESVRMTFPSREGRPTQVALPDASALSLRTVDLQALPLAQREEAASRLTHEEAQRPFDLARGPLLRATLLTLGEPGHVLLLTMHHIISDGWSMGVLIREMAALYAAFSEGRPSPLPEPVLQYADYALWQRTWLQDQALDAQLTYWKTRLEGAPASLELPTDFPRPAEPTNEGAHLSRRLPAELTGALKALSRAEGATLFMTLLAAFQVLLSRHSGQQDVVVGTDIANRTRANTEGLIGFFINQLVMRGRLDTVSSFRELLALTRETALAAYAHQDLPFEELVRVLNPKRGQGQAPLFQTKLVLQNAPMAAIELPGLTLTPLELATGSARLDLLLSVQETPEGLACTWEFSTELFKVATVERLAEQFQRLLEGIAARPEQPWSELPLLSEAERQQVLVAWNDTRQVLSLEPCVHRLFQAQAERTPEAPAASFAGQHLTYRELDARANRLAWHLRALGVGAETRVGVFLERSLHVPVALLAILKAGGAFVPLDPAYPAARTAFILEDAGVPLVLTQESLAEELPSGAQLLCVDTDADVIARKPDTTPDVRVFEDSLAYVIYTSGSTGTPKGALLLHRGLANTALAAARAQRYHARSRVLQFASPAFDASVWEVFSTLLTGACLVLASRDELLPEQPLRHLLESQAVTAATLTPSVLAQLSEAGLPHLETLVSAGEALPPALAQRWSQGRTLLNAYGPTEVTVCASISGPVDSQRISLGRPFPNVQLYVLDARLTPVPLGAPGELYVGGVGLARGYLARPALTAERFVPHPFASTPGERLYRTGDRVRFRADGELEFLGRADAQVKLRGIRIEPGELEAVLSTHPTVDQAVALVREDVAGDKRLVAYVVARANHTLDLDALRSFLKDRLPEALQPSAFVPLPALPVTPSGKRDLQALPAPDGLALQGAFVPPEGPLEQRLADLWAPLLGVLRVGRHDSFFDLGGHSLLATQLVSRVREAFGVDLPLPAIFDHPTVAGLSSKLADLHHETPVPVGPALVAVPRGEPLPLSFAQQRLWFIDQLEPGSALYNIPAAIGLDGVLDVSALEQAFSELIRRHEALRTTFPARDGQPLQHIASSLPVPLRRTDLSLSDEAGREPRMRALFDEEARRPFDLAQGPLLRTLLITLAPERHVLLLTQHHIVSDGWSMGVLVRELTSLYAAFREGRPSPLPALPLQYADYAAWQRDGSHGAVLEAQRAYWTRQLSEAPAALDLPTDHPRPATPSSQGATHPLHLSATLAAALRNLGQDAGATPFMMLLASFQALLARHAGQDDVCVGTPIAGRRRAELEGMLGCFVNTLVLRARPQAHLSFRELLAQVRETTLAAYANQDLPFEQVVDAVQPPRQLGRSPLFQAMFVLQNTPDADLSAPGLTLRPLALESRQATFELTLSLKETADGLHGFIEYRSDLFEAATIGQLATHFERLLEAAVANPEQSLGDLPLLSDDERRQLLVTWNDTRTDAPRQSFLHRPFEEQAARTPDALALTWGETTLTYAALDQQAHQLASHLRTLGVDTDVRVALCVEPSPEWIVCLLAILKAGGVYVPLDPRLPSQRLGRLRQQVAPRVLLTTSALSGRVPEGPGLTLCLDTGSESLAAGPTTAPAPAFQPAQAAYVIFTSGSTGEPKGVVIEHRAAAHTLRQSVRDYDLRPGDRLLQWAAPGFDVSVQEVFSALGSGATLVLAPRQLIGTELHAFLRAQAVTTLTLTASALATLPDEPLPTLRSLVVGGESCPAGLMERWAAGGRRFVNQYGPTEATIAATSAACAPGSGVPPLGRPFPDTTVYVLDAALRPVPRGVRGELFIGGAGLARGYLGHPGLTAERFLPDPFASTPGARLYRTGDLVRFRADGQLEFQGRTDAQVKLRGIRIEPGEIEATLTAHAAVEHAAVVVREDVAGDKRLVAYVVARANHTLDLDALRSFLKDRLPEALQPSAFVPLKALPVTPSGKRDLQALPAPDGLALQGAFVPPEGPLEQRLADLWAPLLGVLRVGRHDSFFDLGGHSLLATQLVSRVREAFGVDLPLRALFEHPTLAAFAAHLAQGMSGAGLMKAPPITPAPRDGKLPLSFAQQRLWFIDQLDPGTSAFNIPTAVRLQGTLEVPALERALQALFLRHEALRTTFAAEEGRPFQVIQPHRDEPLTVLDLQGLPESEHGPSTQQLLRDESQRPFDLAKGPLLRSLLLRLAPGQHVLLLTMHHIVSDGWSMGVLIRELIALYAAFREGLPSPLPALPLQYADYAAWQHDWLRGEVLEAQLSWWREALAGAPQTLELPGDAPRPLTPTGRGAQYDALMPLPLSRALDALGRQEGATPFMVLLAAFNTLMARYSGQRDLLIGTDVANRSLAETEGMLGFFINQLVLRARVEGDPTVRELIARTREASLAAYAHQDVPFEELVRVLNPARNDGRAPLFQVKFTLQHAPTRAVTLPGLTLEPVTLETHAAKLDLLVVVGHGEDGLRSTWEYNTDLFTHDTVARMAGHFQKLLEGFAATPEARVSALTLLSDAERHEVVTAWGGPRLDFRAEDSFAQRFEAQVERTPDAVALTYEDEQLTYRELNLRANQLAWRLRGMGIRPDSRVALFLHRSLELVVGLLGILKAGGAYVPLDPQTPTERLSSLLEEAEVAVILSQDALSEALPETGARVLYLDSEWDAIVRRGRPENPPPLAGPGNLAYVIYTSGSTGRPKGVAVEHRQLCAYTAGVLERMSPPPGASFATVSTFAADLGHTMVFPALATGGNLHVLSRDRVTSPEDFAAYFERHGIDCLKIVPSHLAALMSAAKPEQVLPRRLLVLGGEASSREWIERIQRLRPGCAILNHYGPTETTVGALTWPVPTAKLPERPNIPTGFPLPGAQVLVLDAHLRPVPVGIPGELCIGGVGVARGYLGRPELTAERFIPNPYAPEPGGRLYRTGDLARRLKDGAVEFLGRIDDQVKIRGFRVETGEVEAVLRQHPDVREAVVLAHEVSPGDRRLAAFVVPTPQRSATIHGHKRYVLPNHLAVAQLNRNETDYIYKEVFELQAYLRHGVTLNDGDCIFDVGSNIGLFSVFANQVCHAPRIFAFEPNPTVHAILSANLALHAHQPTVFDCGVAAEEGTAEFTFFPGFSLLSGFHADAETEKSVVKAYMLNQENASPEQLAGLAESADDLLAERFEARTFTAKLRTLSDIIDAHDVQAIDLLKVNVEKSELQVLQGLREEHWGRIRQMVVEIDVKENVEPITELVRRHGFDLVVDQDVLLSGTQLCYLYAIRPSAKGRLVPQTTPDAHLRTLPVRTASPFLTHADVTRWLTDRLPSYMVPSAVMMLEALPLTANGKVDRQALPTPVATSDERPYVAPRNQTEEQLSKICAELLNVPRMGIHDDFFELGGHSLLGTQVVSRIRAAFGAELRLRDLFDTPTVAGLAGRIVDLRAGQVEEDRLEDLLTQIEGLSNDEVQALLAEEESPDDPPQDSPADAAVRRKVTHE